ncbi:hypothetical protein [Nereida ignava]|uniref:hypothetical protein n=1 Tax=Nereida ignava TaxID=282199 RepID=UPI0030F80D86
MFVRKDEWFPEKLGASGVDVLAALPGFAAVIASVNHTDSNYNDVQTDDFDTETRLSTVKTDIARRDAIAGDVMVKDGNWREALAATVKRATKRRNGSDGKMLYTTGILAEVAGWLLCCIMLDKCMTEKTSLVDLCKEIATEWRKKVKEKFVSHICKDAVAHFTENSNFMQDRFVKVYTALAQDRVGVNYRGGRRKPASNLLFYNWGNPLHLLLSTDDPRIRAFDKICALRADNDTAQYHSYARKGMSSLAWHEIDSNAQQAYLQVDTNKNLPLAYAEEAAERAVLAETYSAAVENMYKDKRLAAIEAALQNHPDWSHAVGNKMTMPDGLQSLAEATEASDVTKEIASFFVVYKNACTDRVSALSRGLRCRTLFENWGKCPLIDQPLLTPITKNENADGVVSELTAQESPKTLPQKNENADGVVSELTAQESPKTLPQKKGRLILLYPTQELQDLLGTDTKRDDEILVSPVVRSPGPSETPLTPSGDDEILVPTLLQSKLPAFYRIMANAYMRSLRTHARIEPAAIFSDPAWAHLFVYSDQTATVLNKLANLWKSAAVPCENPAFSAGADTRAWFSEIDAQLRARLDPTNRGKNDVLSCNRT